MGAVTGVRPVFISGVYRSGTTFLSALINAHPDFSVASSSVKFLRFCAGRYGDIREPSNRELLVKETLARVAKRWQLSFDPDRVEAALSQSSEASYAGIYDAIMRQMLPNSQKNGGEWAEKLAVQWDRIPRFLEMFPNGRVIHIFRDPRDVTASYKAMTNEKWPTHLDAAFNCLHAMQTLQRLQDEIPANQLLVVHAESIARSPQKEVSRICDFLEVAPCDSMLHPDKYGEVAGEDWRTNTSFADTLKGFPKVEPRWPQYLTRAETIFVEMVCQPLMSDYGYPGRGQSPNKGDWDEVHSFLEDDFIAGRFAHMLATGEGAIGYRTDPYLTEMKIVFPERFEEVALA